MEFIKKLNAEQLAPDEVASLCACIKMQNVTKNQKICSFDGPAKFIYYLIEGSAEQHSCDNGQMLQKLLRGRPGGLCRSRAQSKMHRLATLVAGQMFGEASWVYGQQAMTTVVASSDCKVWALPFVHANKFIEMQIEVRKY